MKHSFGQDYGIDEKTGRALQNTQNEIASHGDAVHRTTLAMIQ